MNTIRSSKLSTRVLHAKLSIMVIDLKMLELQECFLDNDLQAILGTVLQIKIFASAELLVLLETICRNALFSVQSLITFSFLDRVQHVANGETTFVTNSQVTSFNAARM